MKTRISGTTVGSELGTGKEGRRTTPHVQVFHENVERFNAAGAAVQALEYRGDIGLAY